MRGHLTSPPPNFIVLPQLWKDSFQPCFCNTTTSTLILPGPIQLPAFPALNTLPIMAALLSYTSDICIQGANLMHSAPWYRYVPMMVNSTTRGHAFDLRTSFCSTARARLFNSTGGVAAWRELLGTDDVLLEKMASRVSTSNWQFSMRGCLDCIFVICHGNITWWRMQ